ncbi:protein SLC31A2 [Xiphophorus couchianus]|uniref:protein SLC31A2 n=1 Tax=Xiphophorus couchianus TaxID=32473 RepID=UPI001016A449|nr:probable low affinity copper uptake protein 2 [Xiphophorus couchianus]XP_032426261.1 probable low affinity copper uptake protein 2 [Xiphophorus hellerii]
MQMTFEASSSVTLLFDVWNVHGPAGMVLSVFVVLLLTVVFEILKVWRVWLSSSSRLAQRPSAYAAAAFGRTESCSALDASESSLAPTETRPPSRNSWLLHVIQTCLHVLQVTLGYMLMLCVMSYNVWIFLGVVLGSALGYYVAFPLLGQMSLYGRVRH